MKKVISAGGIALFIIFCLFNFAFADETLTITTYYPSPYGSYNQLTTTGNTYLATAAGSMVGIGTTNPGYTLSVAGTIWANGSAISAGATTWSDSRLKENIKPMDNCLMKISKLKGIYYNWKKTDFTKNFPEGRQIGLIAQEVEKTLPELIIADKDGYKSIDYSKLTVILINALNEQQKKIAELEKKVKGLFSK